MNFRISDDFKFTRNLTIGGDLKNNSKIHPWNVPSSNKDSMIMTFKIQKRKYIFFSEALFIHPPSEFPLSLSRADPFEFEGGKLIEVLITPEVIMTDEDLKALEFKDRSCYMVGEKQLKFYKVYTTRNCEIECLSNHSSKACGCVPFDVVRGPETRICGIYDDDCTIDLKYDLKYSKSIESSEACSCFLPCDSII